MNVTRSPGLVYHSGQARGHGIVAANVTVSPGTYPDTLVVLLRITDVTNAFKTVTRRIAWTAGQSDGVPRRIALEYSAADLTLTTPAQPAALLPYTVEVKFPNSDQVVASDTGHVVVVDRGASIFGAGWWLDGYEQVVIAGMPSGQRLWVGGDGSARVYADSGNGNFIATPSADRPDTLWFSGQGYIRRLPNRAYVEFNGSGKHVRTVNRRQEATEFGYSTNGVLSTITLPVPSGAPARLYQFAFDTVGSIPRLRSVSAPSVEGAARVVSIGHVAGTRVVTSFSGPIADTVRFVPHSTIPGLIASRVNRLNHSTNYTYDAGLLASMSVPAATPAVNVAFCPAEAASLAACAAKAEDTTLVRTRYDGPRNDIVDTIQFFVNRFGAPVRIVDALRQQTTISRGLPKWPLLVTRVVRPGSAIDSAEYDLGHALIMKSITRVDDARYATTSYEWEASRALVKTITAPTGVTKFTYDAQGNRTTEQRGVVSPRWTTYTYDAFNRVIAAFDSGATIGRPFRFGYGRFGNLDTSTSPMGFVSVTTRDDIGRVIKTRSPIDAAQTQFTTTTTAYDLMDRAISAITVGPRVGRDEYDRPIYSTTFVDSLIVRTAHDKEGRAERVSRRVYPDSNRLDSLVTRTTYDAAHRKLSEIAADGAHDDFAYDDGVNLTRARNRRGQEVVMAYDELNRLKTRTIPETSVTEVLGSLSVPSDVEQFAYDSLGNMVEADNAAAKVRREYNIGGTLRSERQMVATTAGGDFTRHVYDVKYTYDLGNRRESMWYPTQIVQRQGTVFGTTNYQYTEHGDLKRITAGLDQFQYFYDRLGRLDSLVYANGVREIRSYDDDDRMTTLLHRAPSAALGWQTEGRPASDTVQWSRLEYDAAGRVVQATAHDGNVTRNGYTAHGSLAWFVRRNELIAAQTETEAYQVDALGNVRQSYQSGAGVTGGWHHYQPGTGRLLGIDRGNGDASDFAQSNVYDAAGNQKVSHRARYVRDINLNVLGLLRTTSQYLYDATGRLRAVKERPHDGSPVAYPEEQFLDQQIRYDALGRRVWVHTANANLAPSACARYCKTERFIYDGDQLLAELRYPDSLAEQDTMLVYNLVPRGTEILDPPPPWKAYSMDWGQVYYVHGMGIDKPLGVYRGAFGKDSVDLSGMRMYTHHDWRGNATAVSFEGGRRLYFGNAHYTPTLPTGLNRELTAYGERTSGGRQSVDWVGSLLTGQLDASGLSYRRNRYYDSQSGRFTQEDPIGLAGGLNLYGFAGGDPVNFSDPFGLCVWDACLAEIALAAAVVYAGTQAFIATREFVRSWKSWSSESEPVRIPYGAGAPEVQDHGTDATGGTGEVAGVVDRKGAKARHDEAMRGTKPVKGKDRDLFPPAVIKPDATAISVRNMGPSDNRRAGGKLRAALRGIPDGTPIILVVPPRTTP
jgi:RHS repeat-associated protein